MPKYKYVNGVLQANDAVITTAVPVLPLAIVANEDDIAEATQLQYAAGRAMVVPEATVVAISQFENPDFIERYKCPTLDGEKVFEGLSQKFSQYEVPVGLLSKLLALSEYKLNIILDDSGSMGGDTDSTKGQASSYMLDYFKAQHQDLNKQMTRWEEEEDRLHLMIEFLAYIPTGPISISFMNRSDRIVLTHDGKTPEQFAAEAHALVHASFKNPPMGGTPTMAKMKAALSSASGLTMHYLFTDGAPNDCTTKQLGEFLSARANPASNPLTFVSCTNVDAEAQWMKDIEENGPFMAEVDDYGDEREEVMHDQGPSFPYSKGLWLMCLLVGAINPYDLDALDDSRPITKYTLDNLMGRVLTQEEYMQYWNTQPRHAEFQVHLKQFVEATASTFGLLGEDLKATQGLSSAFAGMRV